VILAVWHLEIDDLVPCWPSGGLFLQLRHGVEIRDSVLKKDRLVRHCSTVPLAAGVEYLLTSRSCILKSVRSDKNIVK
jgi:hypothetical protein